MSVNEKRERALRTQPGGSVTVTELMELRVGARLRVALRSGRELEVTLTLRPYLVASDKPGLSRVRLDCFDHELYAKAAKSDTRSILGAHKIRHEIAGHRVLAIIEPALSQARVIAANGGHLRVSKED